MADHLELKIINLGPICLSCECPLFRTALSETGASEPEMDWLVDSALKNPSATPVVMGKEDIWLLYKTCI